MSTTPTPEQTPNNNTGKRASSFRATAPDGTILEKKSFNVHSEEAYIGAYLHNGKYVASGVTAEIRDWGQQIFLKATKQ